MTTDEKLEKFYDLVTAKTREEADQILTDYRAALDKAYQDHCDIKKKQAEYALLHDKTAYQREMNRILSEEQLRLRKELSSLRDFLTEKVFQEVSGKLDAYKKTDAYPTLLCERIRNIRTFLNGDEAVYYVSSSDSALIPVIAERCGVTPVCSDQDFLGGILAVCRARNIEINETFASALEREKASFVISEKEDET